MSRLADVDARVWPLQQRTNMSSAQENPNVTDAPAPRTWRALILIAVGVIAIVVGAMAGDFQETATNGATL